MKLTTGNLELRGLVNKTSKNGNTYYVIYAETPDGEPLQFCCKDSSVFPEGLKKGDKIVLDVFYNPRFKDLSVIAVYK